MSGIVDWHTHWLSPRSLEWLQGRPQAPRVVRDAAGQLSFEVNSSVLTGSLPIGPSFYDGPTRITHIDQAGIAHQVISWPTTLGVDPVLQPAEARELFALYNDDLAALVLQYPQRLSGLAALTTSDIEWSARELERAHALGLIGAVLPAGAFLNLEGAQRLAPIFDVAEHLGSHIYLHTGLAHDSIPGQWAHPPASDSSHARWLLESTSQFAAAWITLGLSPFLDAYPNVSVQLAMLGGVLPVLLGSLGEAHAPAAGIRRLYIDSGIIGTDADTLALAIRHLGAERILFGSDYPLQSSVQVLQTLRDNALPATASLLASGGQLLDQLREKQRR